MAPCRANITTVVTPTSSANGVSRSIRVTCILPRASIGTPLMTLPKATPSSSARPSDAIQKTKSQVERQRAPGRLLRNSIATVRRIITSSTSISAR